MDNSAELDALKKQVAQLKQQLDEIRQFCGFSESDEGKKNLALRCSGLFLYHPEKPEQLQAMFTAHEDGPSLALWGKDEKARLIVEVQNDRPVVRLYQKDLKTAVEISETDNNEPYVTVFHEGRPRGLIKGLPEQGALSAIHDDGQVRVLMSSQLTHGDLLVVGGDMRAAVKLSSQGQDGGGFLTVNHPNGKAAAIISSTQAGGCVILNDSRGQIVDSLPSMKSNGSEAGGE